jgi:hypothetical protein
MFREKAYEKLQLLSGKHKSKSILKCLNELRTDYSIKVVLV